MEYKKSEVLKVDILTPAEFAEKYANGVSTQALSYAMDNDKLDYVCIGKNRFIVLTKKSKTYVPNSHPNRSRMRT